MNGAPANPSGSGKNRGWSVSKWLTVIVIIFAVHLGFLILFGQKKQITPKPVTNVPNLTLEGSSDAQFNADDPTLFALPHFEGFAGSAWMQSPQIQFHRRDWSEPPRPLPLQSENLGSTFNQFMQTNSFATYALDFKPALKSTTPTVAESADVESSTMQITGNLAQRKLLAQPDLPSLPANDVIAQSKIQAMVGADGNVVSVVLLQSSGLDAADKRALEIARSLRFAPSSDLTDGRIIFNWQTVPSTNTNDNANTN